jgi:hypothetical protein
VNRRARMRLRGITDVIIVSLLLVSPLIWVFRDGLGPDSVESMGWEAVERFFWSFNFGPILLLLLSIRFFLSIGRGEG